MENKNIAVLGCARDVAKHLSRTMQTIKGITDIFSDYRIFIYENDSKDATMQILLNYRKQDPKLILKSEPWIARKYPHRTWRIAYARNKLKSLLIESKFTPDYVIVIDLDDIARNIENGKQFVIESLKKENYWDCIFPHPTYDMWCYRTKKIIYNYWEVLNHFTTYFPNFNQKKYLQEFKKDLVPDENNLCTVLSSFNGIGLYKYDVYIKGEYSGVNNFYSMIQDINLRSKIQSEECEHVNFHRSLGKDTKIKVLHNFIYV